MLTYAIISARDIAQLMARVQQYCLDGWTPHGGVMALTYTDEFALKGSMGRSFLFLQAMTKPISESPLPPAGSIMSR